MHSFKFGRKGWYSPDQREYDTSRPPRLYGRILRVGDIVTVHVQLLTLAPVAAQSGFFATGAISARCL